MKHLLLISGITCAFVAPVFAGSTPNQMSKDSKDAKRQSADAGDMNQDPDQNQQQQNAKKQQEPQILLIDTQAATPGQPADQTKQANPDGKASDDQMQTKILLVGGTSPSKAESAPADKTEQKKSETDAEKQQQQQPLVV